MTISHVCSFGLTSTAVNAPALIDYWMENFRLQVEARSGRLHDVNYGKPVSIFSMIPP